MRALASSLVGLGVVLVLTFGCGKSEDGVDAPAAGATSAGSSSAGSSSAGSAADGGTPASSGSANAGASQGGSAASSGSAGTSTTGGQPDGQAGADGASAGAGMLLDCDPKKILCKRVAPTCDAGEVPSVAGSCYGDCVKIESCGCSAAEQCPEPEKYTCWSKQHCGPFVR